jgi:hypothetical protein
MQSHSDVELVFTAELHQVLVAANAASFESLGAQLFIFIRHEMNAEWEVIDVSPLSAQVEDADLGVWDTTAETRLWVRFVFTVAIAKKRKRCIITDPERVVEMDVIRFLEITSHQSPSSSP